MALLGSFGLAIHVSPAACATRNGQIALLTLVNLARRTFLAGVEVAGVPHTPLLTPLGDGATVAEAVSALGGILTDTANAQWPLAVIGDSEDELSSRQGWRLSWDGWRGGVMPLDDAPMPTSDGAMPLAPAMAAAICAAEAFALHAGDHPMAGRRAGGISLWEPSKDWRNANADEPVVQYLPSRLWLIGLGNLGQACAWLLGCLPYVKDCGVTLMLQDDDRIAESNESTSLLANDTVMGAMKTRRLAEWLEARGFESRIVERRFGAWTRRSPDEPSVALCGVDNALARSALENAGFELVIESGLGGGPQSFRSFSMHSFPGPRRASEIWSPGTVHATDPDTSVQPAYADLKRRGLDQCGLAQLASRTVAVPFVGLVAAGVVVSELLRRLHGGPAFHLIAGSLLNIGDIETHEAASLIYSHGHVAATSY